jgi:hypothetical protein
MSQENVEIGKTSGGAFPNRICDLVFVNTGSAPPLVELLPGRSQGQSGPERAHAREGSKG